MNSLQQQRYLLIYMQVTMRSSHNTLFYNRFYVIHIYAIIYA
jgi:hypothetical protein